MNDDMSKGRGMKGMMILVIIILLLLVGAGIWFFKGAVNKNSYYAVFLSNNQVYFGKLAKPTRSFVELADIYYLQINQQIQPIQKPAEGEETEGAAEEQKPKFSLVKLGQEIHGPTDRMIINRDHVLFMEELKEDSRVVQAISQAKSGGTNQGNTEEKK